MKLDRQFYAVAEVMQMAADAIAPIPKGKQTAFRSREAWFPPDALGGEFCAVRFTDDAGWFPSGVVGGPFCPCADLPGEYVGFFPATVEEARHKGVGDAVLLQAIGMAQAGEIRPTSGGVYVREWNGWTREGAERLILTVGEARQLLATFPVTIEDAVADEGATLKRAVLIAAHKHMWPTIERDLRDASSNGLAAAKASKPGMWREAAALDWAKARGKLSGALAQLPSKVHRIAK